MSEPSSPSPLTDEALLDLLESADEAGLATLKQRLEADVYLRARAEALASVSLRMSLQRPTLPVMALPVSLERRLDALIESAAVSDSYRAERTGFWRPGRMQPLISIAALMLLSVGLGWQLRGWLGVHAPAEIPSIEPASALTWRQNAPGMEAPPLALWILEPNAQQSVTRLPEREGPGWHLTVEPSAIVELRVQRQNPGARQPWSAEGELWRRLPDGRQLPLELPHLALTDDGSHLERSLGLPMRLSALTDVGLEPGDRLLFRLHIDGQDTTLELSFMPPLQTP